MTPPSVSQSLPWLTRWHLLPDGEPVQTAGSLLIPVRRAGVSAMLKITREHEERRGSELMVWWAGKGAARVLDHDGDALLLERATGARRLDVMALQGQDDTATRILCASADRLHEQAGGPASLVPLDVWFRALAPAAVTHGGVLVRSSAVAQALLAEPQEPVALHGDLHHGNVLDFDARGWLAIDPKGLAGERGFDFANMLCNPIGPHAREPGRLVRQASVITGAARLDRRRLLSWVLAYAGLSAAWTIAVGGDPGHALAIAGIAARELG